MASKLILKVAGIGMLGASITATSHAQAGPCKDPWINQAFHQMYNRAPSGSGNAGECDITRYGNGHWSSYQDLVSKIAQHNGPVRTSMLPPVPAPSPIQTRPVYPGQSGPPLALPSSADHHGSSGLISDAGGNNRAASSNIISQDGGSLVSNSSGTMRSLQSVDKPHAPAGKYLVIPGGNLVDASGNVVRSAGSYTLVLKNGVNAIGAGGRAPVVGTIVTP